MVHCAEMFKTPAGVLESSCVSLPKAFRGLSLLSLS